MIGNAVKPAWSVCAPAGRPMDSPTIWAAGMMTISAVPRLVGRRRSARVVRPVRVRPMGRGRGMGRRMARVPALRRMVPVHRRMVPAPARPPMVPAPVRVRPMVLQAPVRGRPTGRVPVPVLRPVHMVAPVAAKSPRVAPHRNPIRPALPCPARSSPRTMA